MRTEKRRAQLIMQVKGWTGNLGSFFPMKKYLCNPRGKTTGEVKEIERQKRQLKLKHTTWTDTEI